MTRKFTDEDLLKAMGLKVNDVFYMPNPSYKYKVVLEEGKIYIKDFIYQEYMLIEHFIKIHKMINREFTIIQPKPTLTEDEKVILRNLPTNWKWIARELDNDLCLFENKPIKKEKTSFWYSINNNSRSTYFLLFEHLFKFIKWEDEPYSIEELLKE